MKFFTTWLIATMVNASAQFIGKFSLVSPAANITADINEAAPGQCSISPQTLRLRGGPEKYIVDFAAVDGGFFSDFQVLANNLGFELSVVTFDGPGHFTIGTQVQGLLFIKEALPLPQGAYVYENDGLKMTVELTSQLKMTVSCTEGTEVSRTFEIEAGLGGLILDPFVEPHFRLLAATCVLHDLPTDIIGFVVSPATETRVYIEVGPGVGSKVFALEKVQ
ncbi:hypothetical protein FOZ61_009688 [Perkinsus olseni]|uniref:Uncharacterized protein n=1 Tax=Perkinsus olseni TaxID=32597 RepID=A0A7J6L0V1_PEROL|nr:hypothetical protein FOZ61_009688 [Perkinsus olseni]KAF4654368.1 hypothetical protein FOL46_008748 [Perkinsus olseni]